MAKVETFKCDQCGKQKQEVNHWYFMSTANGNLILYRWSDAVSRGDKHLCGQQCVVAEVAEWMSRAVELVEVKQ